MSSSSQLRLESNDMSAGSIVLQILACPICCWVVHCTPSRRAPSQSWLQPIYYSYLPIFELQKSIGRWISATWYGNGRKYSSLPVAGCDTDQQQNKTTLPFMSEKRQTITHIGMLYTWAEKLITTTKEVNNRYLIRIVWQINTSTQSGHW